MLIKKGKAIGFAENISIDEMKSICTITEMFQQNSALASVFSVDNDSRSKYLDINQSVLPQNKIISMDKTDKVEPYKSDTITILKGGSKTTSHYLSMNAGSRECQPKLSRESKPEPLIATSKERVVLEDSQGIKDIDVGGRLVNEVLGKEGKSYCFKDFRSYFEPVDKDLVPATTYMSNPKTLVATEGKCSEQDLGVENQAQVVHITLTLLKGLHITY
jgi:hypothetical protein